MQEFINIFKETLSEWFRLTLNHPHFAGALVFVAFLVTAIAYQIRLFSLHKQRIALEKKQIGLQDELMESKQEWLEKDEELAASTRELITVRQSAESNAQHAENLKDKLILQNRIVIEGIQSLLTRFELTEYTLPDPEDFKSDRTGQAFSDMVEQLSSFLGKERQAKSELLQAFQSEKKLCDEKQAEIDKLHDNLSDQASRIAQLEGALEAEKSLLLKEREQAQMELTQALQKHVAELGRLTELEQQALELVNTRQQLSHLQKSLNDKESTIIELQSQATAIPVAPGQANPGHTVEIQDTIQESIGTPEGAAGGIANKLKTLFGKPRTESASDVTNSDAVKDAPDNTQIEPEPSQERPSLAETRPNPFEKLKSIIGFSQNESAFNTSESPETTHSPEEAEPKEDTIRQSSTGFAKEPLEKIKGLFSKAR